MKLLGHAYVAVNSVPEGRKDHLIIGSLLPEIMFYTKANPFEYEEIHEGGERVYRYLLRKSPEWKNLGLGMLAHSLEKGADRFNLDDNLAILGYEGAKVDKLRGRLSEVLGVSQKTAKTRAHHILELAAELTIIREEPEFVSRFIEATNNRQLIEETKQILAECFKKPPGKVSASVDELFAQIKPSYFQDSKGLALLWGELSRALPDPEPKTEELAELLNSLSREFAGREKIFLEKCIFWTKGNIEEFLRENF